MTSFDEYRKLIQDNPVCLNGEIVRQEALERHFRIFSCLMAHEVNGPTLDVACGNAVFYPAIKKYIPALLPYSVTDIKKQKIGFGDDAVECKEFECEKDVLPYPDKSFGTVLFCDVIEHLIVDPVWVMLEFNRVLKDDGNLIISTPNACHIKRVLQILSGQNSATENHYKPTSVYQRHNREWTVAELNTLYLNCGFSNTNYSTHSYLLDETEKVFYQIMSELKLTDKKELDFGPEIFIIGRKVAHKTIENTTNPDERWATWLYSHHGSYRRRPAVFPIVLGDDYG